MKNRTDCKYFPSPVLFLAVILFLLLLNACTEKQGKTVPKKAIPEKIFISILTDLYLTDGLLTVPQIRDKYPDKDSVSAYIDAIVSHGYTKEDMDHTIEYYFVKKPKRLIRIYDQLLGELTEIDTRLSNIPVDEFSSENNEWSGLSLYNFPDFSGEKDPEFSLPLNSQGSYTLEFMVTIYSFDQTENPGFTAWLCSADSSETGKKYFLPSIKYIKDGYPHIYIVTGKNDRSTPVILKGNLYDRENNPEDGERYGKIEKIRFSFSPGI